MGLQSTAKHGNCFLERSIKFFNVYRYTLFHAMVNKRFVVTGVPYHLDKDPNDIIVFGALFR